MSRLHTTCNHFQSRVTGKNTYRGFPEPALINTRPSSEQARVGSIKYQHNRTTKLRRNKQNLSIQAHQQNTLPTSQCLALPTHQARLMPGAVLLTLAAAPATPAAPRVRPTMMPSARDTVVFSMGTPSSASSSGLRHAGSEPVFTSVGKVSAV